MFSIEAAEKVGPILRSLNTKAQVLSASLVQADDLDFQIRNFYPFPLAFAYRTISAFHEPAQLYQEQLRIAENFLAFLGSVGLALAVHTKSMLKHENINLTSAKLIDYWRKGISPGHWQLMGHQAALLLRGNNLGAVSSNFAALWFKGTGGKESDFARTTKAEMVELINDFKHGRGPKTPNAYMEHKERMQKTLKDCYKQVDFLIQNPIRLVQDFNNDWKTKKTVLDTLVYVGDHPGLKQERVTLSLSPSKNELYLELTDEEWASLYPLISVQYCPSCQSRETYMIDRWAGQGGRVVLKSFERGHTLDNDSTAKTVGEDLDHWLQQVFASR